MQHGSKKNDVKINGKRHASTQSWTPPVNFALVEDNIYRSAYPEEFNIPFLAAIGIKTIVLLSIESLSHAVRKAIDKVEFNERANNSDDKRSSFFDNTNTNSNSIAVRNANSVKKGKVKSNENHIRIMQIADMCHWERDDVNSGDDFSQYDVQRAIDLAIDTRWHPILLTCPTGELQTSVVVGCMRRYQHWSLSAVYNECELFTCVAHNLRTSVMTFIASWNPESFPIHACDIVHRHLQLYSKLSGKNSQIVSSQTLAQHSITLGNLDNSTRSNNTSTTTSVTTTRATTLTNTDNVNYTERRASELTCQEDVAKVNNKFHSSIVNSNKAEIEENAVDDQMPVKISANQVSNTKHAEFVLDKNSRGIANKNVNFAESVDGNVNITQYTNKEIDKVVESDTQINGANATLVYCNTLPELNGIQTVCEENHKGHSVPSTINCECVTCGDSVVYVHYSDWFVNAQRYAEQREHNEIVYSTNNAVMNVIAQYRESVTDEHRSTLLERELLSKEEQQQQHLEQVADQAQVYDSKHVKRKHRNEYSVMHDNGKMEMLLPFIRYAGVRNPPAIDKRSSFTKESLVEDDDD